MRAPRALSVLLLGLALTACGSGAEQQVPSADTNQPFVQVQPTTLRVIHGQARTIDTQNFVTVGLQGPREKRPGEMQVPPVDQPMLLGWYCPSRSQPPDKNTHPIPMSESRGAPCGAPAPGELGPAILAGHVNGGGQDGVFAQLAKTAKDDVIEVDRDDYKTAVFKVSEVQVVKKSSFPTQRVYGDTKGPELRLITCGGGSNELETLPDGQRSYKDQTIVYAHLTELRPIR